MAYSELIKSFKRVRSYLREFYVYGFRHRTEIGDKSNRSYDNERRRVESWLGEYLEAGQDGKEKRTYLSVDSRAIPHNPFFRPFKAKSFTDNDVKLHFAMMDILYDAEDDGISLIDILDQLEISYELFLDETSVRKKLKEYVELGLVTTKKDGRSLVYKLSTDDINLDSFEDALLFYSETAPVGVAGSFLLDKLEEPIDIFTFKHHHLLYALDSEIMCDLLTAISSEQSVIIDFEKDTKELIPCKIYISAQTGRHFLFAYSEKEGRFLRYRLNRIEEVKLGKKINNYSDIRKSFEEYAKPLWGVAYPDNKSNETEHVEMVVEISDNEYYVIDRLNREKRGGHVEKIDDNHYLFSADVYSTQEMLPWVRTFIGRIKRFNCSNKEVEKLFWDDISLMEQLYK